MRRRYGPAYQPLNDILLNEDHARVNFEVNTDEYEAEAGAVLPLGKTGRSLEN